MISIFSRGVRLEQKKSRTMRGAVEPLPVPEVIAVPLPGAEASSERCIRAGEAVRRFSQLSMPQNSITVCAPAAGEVTEVKTVPHPLAGEITCAVIRTDGSDREIRLAAPGVEPVPEEIIRLAAAAGIIDEYDGVPLYKKLRRFRRIKADWLAADALDDEPYVCSGLAVLREMPDKVRAGLELAALACGAKERKIAVASELRARRYARLSGGAADMLVSGGGIYPAWPNLSKQVRRRGLRPGLIGVQALAALEAAVNGGEPQVSTVVTVAGEGLRDWKNLRVALGTPVGALLEACGVREGAVILMGSPITGGLVTDPQTPVTADTRCVLALPEAATAVRVFPCIGCGRCARACPQHIMPWYIHRLLQQDQYPDPRALLRVEKCCGCNACSVACPSGIALAQSVGRAMEIKERGA